MTKKTIYSIIALIVILVLAGFIWWQGGVRKEQPVPAAPEVAVPVDTTDAIQQELAGINVGDIDAEFKDVDEALKGL